jgi:uncharacterized membrane protein (DUF2068 family)
MLWNYHLKIPASKNISKGIQTIAVFEAFKGILVLIAGFALLNLVHRDLQYLAENIVRHLHMNPARHYPRIFLEAIAGISSSRIKLFAAFAFLYSVIRFVEAYGLWHFKTWAEWFAILSGAIYIPVELVGLFRHANVIKLSIFLVNLFIVLYLLYIRIIIRNSPQQLINIDSKN